MRQLKLTALRTSRRRAIVARCLLAVAGTALVAACGSVAAPAAGGAPAAGAPAGGAASSAAPAKAALTITVQNGIGTTAKHWTLRCDPAGGTHPHPAATCSALLRIHDLFAPPPAHRMCPMILASAKRATFTGTWFGRKIHQTIVDGGCDLAVWSKLGQVMH
jgi:Subtilisin inhibitor-like